MNSPNPTLADGYESFYREFDSPLMRAIRREAYGEDIGQHSWVSAQDLRADITRLQLSAASRFIDLGCGPCGPLVFVLANTGCRGTGVELSGAALRAGWARAAEFGVAASLTLHEADLNARLPSLAPAPEFFDAAMSLDVVLHLRDRAQFFSQVARLLTQRGRFLFTDAGVLTGAVSSDEVRRRSVHGYTQFVASGWNERLLQTAGFRLLESEDRTATVVANASGRLAAMQAHRVELERAGSAAAFESQQSYLETVIELSARRAVSRFMYLAEIAAADSAAD